MSIDCATTIAILFVEDEPDIRHIVELVLARESDIVLTTFATPFDALDHARTTDTRYDLVLLNYLLPGMSGVDFATRATTFASTRDARRVLITANVPPGGVASYLADGAIDAVIVKPFDIATLAGRIRAALNGHTLTGARDAPR